MKKVGGVVRPLMLRLMKLAFSLILLAASTAALLAAENPFDVWADSLAVEMVRVQA